MKKIILTLLILCSLSAQAQQIDTIGIYYKSGDKLVRIEPIKYTETTASVFGGCAKVKFDEAHSKNVVENRTEFYYCLGSETDADVVSLMSIYTIADKDNPINIMVAKFVKKKNRRELVLESLEDDRGISRIGIAEAKGVDVEVEKIRKNLYKVTIDINGDTEDEYGDSREYCIMHKLSNGGGGFMPVYAFSIK